MQTTSNILMVRPVSFGFNAQTAQSNAFQQKPADEQNIQQAALAEFDALVQTIKDNGVNVYVVDDTIEPHTPDSIFPNNWISTDAFNNVFLYPMQAENRRLERRTDIVEELQSAFSVNHIYDLSHFETEDKFLEGTGSMVPDRDHQIIYACISPRTNAQVLAEFCRLSGYTSVLFHAVDQNGLAIYHTNVLMCLGADFAVICLDTIKDVTERQLVTQSFHQTGKEIIEISLEQMNQFAGNMLELQNHKGERLLVMSSRAYHSLLPAQVSALQKHVKIVHSDIKTIENNGGGSARCMIAEIYLKPIR
jgi:hypothetical protein